VSAVMHQLREEHAELWPQIEALRETAVLVDFEDIENVVLELENGLRFLTHHLLPHATAEEAVLYRAYDQLADSPWATDTMKRDHAEIRRLIDDLAALRLQLFMEPLTDAQKQELRRVLYGLHAVLKLHFAEEEEILVPRLEAGLSQDAADQLMRSMGEHATAEMARAGW